jgi:acyl-coenzyme A synthetase/AMP-(fatty) acid ligase
MQASLIGMLATAKDHAVAISAPGRPPLTYGALRHLIDRSLATLNALGIGRNDRLAIVLSNGPEMATCFISAACGVASAPLNPAYRADEFEFYLSDLRAKALVVEHDSSSPAIAVAQKLGVPIINLVPGSAAGDFTLSARDAAAHASSAPSASSTSSAQGGFAQSADTSMVLHTSGTTSRPKIAGQPVRVSRQHRAHITVSAYRLWFEHHAAVSHPRPDRRCVGATGSGLASLLHTGLQCAEILWLDGRSQAHLVHRRAHHAPGHRQPRQQKR